MSEASIKRPFWPALLILVLASRAAASSPADCSEAPHPVSAPKLTLGERHHPIGRPLPDNPNFNQPDRCRGALRFFDQNHNGEADPGEPRVFGSGRLVDCGSCHGESPEVSRGAAASVVLRQDAATLCLVCHRL